jgi:hypothetical protein
MSESTEVPNAEPIETKNTPKIDIATKRVFVLYDSKTKSLMSAFDNPVKATNFIRKLVKKDLKTIIDDLRLQIVISEDDDEDDNKLNLERISALKTLLMQYNTFDLSKNTTFIYDGKMINRYFVWSIRLNEEIDETEYNILD